MKYGLWRKNMKARRRAQVSLSHSARNGFICRTSHGGFGTLLSCHSLAMTSLTHSKSISFKAIDRPGFVSKFGHHSSLSGWNIQSFLHLPLGPCPSHCYIAMEHHLWNINLHGYGPKLLRVIPHFTHFHRTDRRTRWRLIGWFHCDLGKSSDEAQTHEVSIISM